MKKGIILAMLMTFQALGIAGQSPRSLMHDARIKVVSFVKNEVITLHALTFTATEIQFEKDETIESIQNGDVAAWTVDVEKNIPNILFVKPTIASSNTNMTVITNKRTYYFHLMSASSQASGASQETYAVKFIYPGEEKSRLLHRISLDQSLHHSMVSFPRSPYQYHWDYSFHGARSIMPLHVFDDGKFTYMQLRSGQAIPAVFSVDTKSGDESVVNFRREGQYLVIHRIAPQFTLREGKSTVASIFNNLLIARRRHHHVF